LRRTSMSPLMMEVLQILKYIYRYDRLTFFGDLVCSEEELSFVDIPPKTLYNTERLLNLWRCFLMPKMHHLTNILRYLLLYNSSLMPVYTTLPCTILLVLLRRPSRCRAAEFPIRRQNSSQVTTTPLMPIWLRSNFFNCRLFGQTWLQISAHLHDIMITTSFILQVLYTSDLGLGG
ncbi:hypothetical protein BDZ89DRAFT_948288, partial [Hymenopellis radicata]